MNAFTIADELAAGRPYPKRVIIKGGHLVRWDAECVAAHLSDLRSFWLDAAAGYVALAENGCTEALADARDALSRASSL